MNPNDVFLALCRKELMSFVNWAFLELNPTATFRDALYLRAMCHQLERIERGEIRHLLIILPPRHLKSFCTSVAFPVWVLGRDPTRTITTVSYGASLSETFSFQSRRIMESPVTSAIFPELVIDRQKASVTQLLTTKNGGRFTTSVGGPLTGTGSDILIIDDPIKADDVASETQREKLADWFFGVAASRLKVPNSGAIIVVAQRLHVDDLPGKLIESGTWEVLELPARETRQRRIALPDGRTWNRPAGNILLPQHLSGEELDRIRLQIGSARFDAQYQQAPVPAGGNIINPAWFETYPPSLRRQDYEGVLQSWDVAAVPGESNDYSVCTTWGLIGNSIDLLDVWRGQLLYPQLRDKAIELRRVWHPVVVVVETVGVGQSLYAELRQFDRRGIRANTPRANKVERMSVESVFLEQGAVRLPEAANWKEAFLAEVAAFPNGKHDDQVDSMSQALFAIRRKLTELRHCSRYKG